MPARVLYVGQEVKIAANGVASGNNLRYLPVQSASCEVTRPVEDVQSFGRLGSLGRVQNAVSTCKADIKTYIAGVPPGTGHINALSASFIQTLTGDALQGRSAVVSATPNGFTMSGILSSLSIDASNGAFATADLSFVGLGEPSFSTSPTGSNFTEQSNMPSQFNPVTSTTISGIASTGCANSFKFTLDIPNESLSCLGGNISGDQGAVAPFFLQVAKPPFKATISVEGTAVDAPTGSALTSKFWIGPLSIVLPAGQVTSRSFNNSVGAVGATYSYTIEDLSANFGDV